MAAFDLDAAFRDTLSLVAEHEVAPSTAARYGAEWATFAGWCERHGLESLPAAPLVVQAYLIEVTGATCDDDGSNLRLVTRASRAEQAAAAIRWAHRRAGVPTPTGAAQVRALIQLLRRAEQPQARKARPVTLEMVEETARHPVGRTWDRDLTLVTLGLFGAFRGGELIAVEAERLLFCPEGLVIGLPRSKGDPVGHGQFVAIAARPDHELCPVRQVRHWLDVSGNSSGWLFPSPQRGRESEHIHLRSLQLVIDRLLGTTHDDLGGFSTHSPGWASRST